MQYLDTVEVIKKRAETEEGRELVRELRRNVAQWKKSFRDDPEVESGWGHVYFCSHCGTFLNFDLESPHEHRCSCCGHVETGAQYDSSWVYLYRYDAVMSALHAAVLYRLEGNQSDLDYFCKVVGFYSENWYRFCEHGRHTWPSGNGKITPQALNEAIFLIRICNGLELTREDLDPGFLQQITEWFLVPCAYFLDVQKRKIHNIPCWLNAAVGTAALISGNEDLRQRAFERRFSFVDQVRGGGVTASHFWYEGSIHYHFFTLEAFMNTMLFAGIYGQEVPEDVQETVYQMLLAPCRYAFSNGILPNPNDGWPNLGLKTYSFIYEMGAKVYAGTERGHRLAALAEAIRNFPGDRVSVPLSYPTYAGNTGLEWLLFAQEADPEEVERLPYFHRSYLFEASQFATLKVGPIEVFHKFGHCTPSHAHPDKMTVEIRAFGTRIAHDLSNCGYAAKLCPEFHRTSISHHTVVMDGMNHPTTDPGQVLDYSDNAIRTRAAEAYPDIDFIRELTIQGEELTDVFEVVNRGGAEHVFDWAFHLDGRPADAPEGIPADLHYTQNGYSYLSEVRQIQTEEDSLILHWTFADGVKGTQTIDLKGKTLFLSKSPDNPPRPGMERTTLLIRSTETAPVFRQKWSFERS
ncbi:MAG: heparinase II/III family protein [Firmicutes bacterium]|nr:heparinase II/III family protein [Bacillota bacterium]